MIVVVLAAETLAQLPPVAVPRVAPHLKRDRTQRIVYPKIIQREDERIIDEELIGMLNYPHEGVRRRVILALGRIGGTKGVAPLVKLLKEETDSSLRSLAAFSLGEIESPDAATTLIEKLRDAGEPLEVRAFCVEALGKIAAGKSAASTLGNYGVVSIAKVIADAIPDPTSSVDREAKIFICLSLTALYRLKQPAAIQAAVKQLRSVDPEIRRLAINAISQMGEGISTAAPSILLLINDKDPLVRAAAARCLATAKLKSSSSDIARLLKDTDQRVEIGAVAALGKIGDSKAATPLMELGQRLLDRYKSYPREGRGVPAQKGLLLLIAEALGNIKDDRAVPLLKSLRFFDRGNAMNPEVEESLAKFGAAVFFDLPPGYKPRMDDWQSVAAFARGLGQVGDGRSRTLLKDILSGAENGVPDTRSVPAMLDAMAKARVDNLRQILLEQLQVRDVFIRAAAANLIGESGETSETIVKALEDALKNARQDKIPDARVAILDAFDKLGRSVSADVLAGETRDPNYVVRLHAFELLKESGKLPGLAMFQPGKAESNHDRVYWRKIAGLMMATTNPVAIIKTDKGDIKIELYASEAPMTVDNFIELSRKGFYNGLSFVRVVPNFVVQAGDPRGDLNGGPGYEIRDEINMRRYEAGTVGMALSGKDTGGSQFFITLTPQPQLDGGYTVFGRVISGMETLLDIARGDVIERIEILDRK